jgi:hypothetical protein
VHNLLDRVEFEHKVAGTEVRVTGSDGKVLPRNQELYVDEWTLRNVAGVLKSVSAVCEKNNKGARSGLICFRSFFEGAEKVLIVV